MRPIAILSHWHTGSTLLSKTFRSCGMKVGNENTFWDKHSEINCEHRMLNYAMVDILRGKDKEKSKGTIVKVLSSFNEEAKKEGWEFYGIKVTHALHTWEDVGPIFKELWPDAIYVLGFQNPLAIIRTLRTRHHSIRWPGERIIESWLNTEDAYQELLDEGAYIVHFPESWREERYGVGQIVKEIGLPFPDNALMLYDELRVNWIDSFDYSDFCHEYQEACEMYTRIKARYLNKVLP